jgi:hypothetical protein
MPDLITTSRATQHTALNTLNSTNPAYLSSLITTASDLIRRTTHRDFTQTTYTEYHSGNIYIREPLRLRQFPVPQISRVAMTPRPALMIQNTDPATNQRATAETTPTSLRLTRIASAVTTTSDLPFTTYPTLFSIATAVNATGSGWKAAVLNNFTNWPATDLRPLQGAASALDPGVTLELYTEQCPAFSNWPPGDGDYDTPGPSFGWRLDDETGELFARLPRGHLNVRIDYTAGFATLPQAVQEAAVQLVLDLYNAGLVNNTLKKATLGTGSFELKEQSTTAILSGKVSMLLAPYVDYSRVIFR